MRFISTYFNFTDDVRIIAREDGLIAVNNAIAVRFRRTGASESIGTRMFRHWRSDGIRDRSLPGGWSYR